jgi:hypothetical protein
LLQSIAQDVDLAAFEPSLGRARGGPHAEPMPVLDQIIRHAIGYYHTDIKAWALGAKIAVRNEG